jgi:hypothetical protein
MSSQPFPSDQLFNFGSMENDQNGLFGGSNQYGSYPLVNMGTSGLAGGNTPGAGAGQAYTAPKGYGNVDSGGGWSGAMQGGMQGASQGAAAGPWGAAIGGVVGALHGGLSHKTTNPFDAMMSPQLSKNFFSWIQNNIGKGAAPYPGMLSAPANPLMKKEEGALLSGNMSGIPGLAGLQQISKNGDPTDVGPAWQAMLKSEQQNIQQNQAQLKEGMSAGGNLAGSPMGQAMANYQQQTALGQNAQLTQAQQAAQEAAAGRQLTASGELGGITSEMMGKLSQYLQGLDQESLDRMYKEFIRTRPEYSPLLGIEENLATQKSHGVAGNATTGQGAGMLGAMFSKGIGNLDTQGTSTAGEQFGNFFQGMGGQ